MSNYSRRAMPRVCTAHVIADLTLDVGEVTHDYLASTEPMKLAVNL
ncbi:hypothetical protein [Paraburkholderia ultramafica]|nr:hypothetical protein [Paraburkholderia ultramafica]